ncbi:MAG: DUF362 domain-containing protein [Desulfobacteraceae bacterium]|nr:DUF362 domain-containing protein [Desulfobacteraceae bacterium]MBC2754523.1 DUF362 domain-containing protein [Desulfobacteraceae bacterium]
MSKQNQVIFTDTGNGIDLAVKEIFDHFGGVRALLKSSKDVYIKVNGVDSKKYAYTDPEVLRQVIVYLRENGANDIYVIENATQGNITRLVFMVTGIGKVCRETGAIPVYLDETPAIPVYLEGLKTFIDLSSFVYERLVEQADQNLYISIPKLKTHSMSQVTLSIKNQFGLVHQHSRIADHNFNLHQKFADIYRILRPDFVIIDALIATNHGHYIAEKNADKCIVPMDCLIGGKDPLASDIIGASFMGFDIADVPHLILSKQTNISSADMANIQIINRPLYEDRKKNLTHDLLEQFPPDLTILRGETRCCMEGCRRNTETMAELFYCDHNGKGNFTILMGKDINPELVNQINTPAVHIAGGCAIQDYGLEMQRRFGKKNVTFSNGCNNLAETIHAMCKHMKVNPIKLSATNPLFALTALAKAKIHGTKAIIPPLI